jgi:diguanylate cyclase (GGDEF)-like protein
MKNYKFYFLATLIIIATLGVSLFYFDYIEKKKESHQKEIYLSESLKMKKGVLELIETKEKATVAIALSLAKDSALKGYILEEKIPPFYYKKIIADYKKNTHYKNIWIQILDKDLNSLYRSWSPQKSDNLFSRRKDLVTALKGEKVVIGISSGKYDLSMRAIVPIFDNSKLLGLLEVTSHFNSIAEQMKHFNINSIILLDVNNTKKLEKPFTNLFMDHHYVANFNAPKELLEYLKKKGVSNYIDSKEPYKIENDYLITWFKLKCVHKKDIGDYLMFKKLSNISSMGAEFVFFRQLTFGVVLVVCIVLIVLVVMFYYIRKQKLYYKDIIDASSDIILVNNKKKIVDVNNAFFQYFKNYSSLREFQEDHNCICNFFEKEDGYLQEKMDGVHWIDFLLLHKNENSVVKIKINSAKYYFKVSASIIMNSTYIYSIVFSDITKQENYKRSLERLTTTDPLTGIGNRRYYEQKLEDEILRANRYHHALSLIMFDIDFFKKVNDTYGHDAGDTVLKEYSALISSLIRNEDIFCRIGGEEFMLILPDTDLNASGIIAEKLRKAVASFDSKVQITMSFGLVQYSKDEKTHSLYTRVDKALYEAKNLGRNRVVVG